MRFDNVSGSGDVYIDRIVIVTGGFPPDAPVPSSGDITKTGFTVSWPSVTDAGGGYEVKIDNGAAVAFAGTSKTFTGLAPNTTHTVEVRALSGDTGIADSDWASIDVTTLAATQLATPSISKTATIGQNTIGITWDPVANADSYDVEVLKAGSRVVLAEKVKDTSYTATDLYAGTEHTFKVKANTGGVEFIDSEWAEKTFSTEEDTSAPEWTVDPTTPAFQPNVAGSFTVEAVKSGVPLVVSYEMTPTPKSAPTFDGNRNTFSWTPAYADAGKTYSIVFSAEGTESKNEVLVTLAPLPDVDWSVGELPAFQETFEASFNIGATISGVAQDVRLKSFKADSETVAGGDPAFDFEHGVFTWNPALGNAKSFTATFAIDAHDTTYTKEVKFSVAAHPTPVWSIDGATIFDVKKEGTCTIGFDTQNPAVSASKITVEFDKTPEPPYTFNGGVFTWTPVFEDNNKDFGVTFRASAYNQSYTHHVTFHVNTVIGYETIFEENFTACTNTAWNGNTLLSDDDAYMPDNEGWTSDENVMVGFGGIRLSNGTSKDSPKGVATSPAITLLHDEQTAVVTMSFRAAYYTSSAAAVSSIDVGLVDPDTQVTDWLTMDLDGTHRIQNKFDLTTNEASKVTIENLKVKSGFKLMFRPTEGDGYHSAVCLDEIAVKQEVRTDFEKFDAPANVMLADGEDDTKQINVSWDAVDGASAYSLRYVDPDGNETVVENIADTQYVIDNLTHNTEYAVSVMTKGYGNIATPDGMYESDWSEPVEYKTAIADDKVVITIPEELPEFTELQEGSFEVSAKLGQDDVTTFVTTIGEIVEDNGSYVLKYTPPRTGAAVDTTYTVSGTITAKAANLKTATLKTATKDFEITVHALPALEALTLADATDVTENSAKLTWSGVGQARLDGDVKVRVWYGSCNMASTNTDEEAFMNGMFGQQGYELCIPDGWLRGNVTFVDDVLPWRLTDNGLVVSKCYRKPLTSFKFYVKASGGMTGSRLVVYGSKATKLDDYILNAMDWEPIKVYMEPKDDEEPVIVGDVDCATMVTGNSNKKAICLNLAGDGSEGYRFIMLQYVKDKGNLQIGRVYAEYAGACAKFKRGTLEEAESLGTEATSLELTGLPAGREFFVELTAVGQFGEEVKSYTRFSTKAASTGTLLIVK